MNATQPHDPEPLDAGLRLVMPGRREAAGAGWTWIVQGWRLFARAPLMWVISMVVVFVLAIALNLVPVLGTLLFQVLQPVIAGGFVVACRSLETGEEFEFEHLFAGFTRRFGPLAILGALLMVAMLAIVLVFALFAGFAVLAAFLAGDAGAVEAAIAASVGTILLGTLVMLALIVPLAAAAWFAPALVVMHDVKPLAAMRASFFACFRNFVPFLVYSLVLLVALVVALIPFGLGMLVWIPLLIASTYVAYRRIFTEDEVSTVASHSPPPPAMAQQEP